MIYAANGSMFYSGQTMTPLFYYPHLIIPLAFQNTNQQVTGKNESLQSQRIISDFSIPKTQKTSKQPRKQKYINPRKEEVNIKNIIPNLVRKLFGFLLSEKCKQLMLKIDPQISKIQISRILNFVQSIKNSLGTYVGKRCLRKLWGKDNISGKNNKTGDIIRKVSRFYLENICANSIILSKRIKDSLKIVHLKYRRKLIKILFQSSRRPKHDICFCRNSINQILINIQKRSFQNETPFISTKSNYKEITMYEFFKIIFLDYTFRIHNSTKMVVIFSLDQSQAEVLKRFQQISNLFKKSRKIVIGHFDPKYFDLDVYQLN